MSKFGLISKQKIITLPPIFELLVWIKHLGFRAGIEFVRHPENK